jgi:hypothetical protein
LTLEEAAEIKRAGIGGKNLNFKFGGSQKIS